MLCRESGGISKRQRHFHHSCTQAAAAAAEYQSDAFVFTERQRGQNRLTVLVSDDSSSSGQLRVTWFTYCTWQSLAAGMIYSCKQNVDMWLVSTWRRFGPACAASINTVSLRGIMFHITVLALLYIVLWVIWVFLCFYVVLSSPLLNVSVFSTRQRVTIHR